MHLFPPLAVALHAQTTSACGHCTLHAAGVACADSVRRRVKKRHALFHQGDGYGLVYSVCSGALKSAVTTADGAERIVSFLTTGELLGLDGCVNGAYTTTVIALEDTEVCSVAPAYLPMLSVMAGLGRELLRMQLLLVSVASANAEVRLAQFLLSHALQLSHRGYSAHDFVLKMSRADIGSYLGLSLETVSRSFSALQKMHLLRVDKRALQGVDLDGLMRLSQFSQDQKSLGPMPKTSPSHAGVYQMRAKPVNSAVITT